MNFLLFALLRRMDKIIAGTLICLLCLSINLLPQSTTLIDFGGNSTSNTFGMAGWNGPILSAGMGYSEAGPGGVVLCNGFEEFSDYMGISGSTRQFRKGERIVVTWYNNSSETIPFTSRISFTDTDQPEGGSINGNWYTMRRFDDYRFTFSEIQPFSSIKTVFNIEDFGVHKTDSIYSSVNINISILWNPSTLKEFLICDKIELMNDADTAKPQKVNGLTASALSDSKIRLEWQPGIDNTGVVEYLIYMNGAVEGYSRTNNYTAVFLEPEKSYSFRVAALDRNRNEGALSDPVIAGTQAYSGASSLINPAGFVYMGAFRLPDDFSYAGEALAYNRDGDGGPSGAGAQDGYKGALNVTNLNQMDQGFVAEFSIPAPVISPSKNLEELNTAVLLNQPVNIRPANVNSWPYVDIWRTGLTYVPGERRLYSSWGFHYQVGGEKTASISCCSADNLASSEKLGAWFVGSSVQPPVDAMLNEYLFSLPQTWANANTNGRALVTGRCRDGGLSGLGPTLYAVNLLGANTPPAPGAQLDCSTLLKYGSVEGTNEYEFPNSIDGYKLCDAWRDVAWISAGNQAAVVFTGVKGLGNNWYGYQGEKMLHDWVIADTPYPDFFATDPDGKGWRANNYQPMAILFNPSDLAAVANGTMNSYQPQPYAVIRFDTSLFWGAGRIIHSASYDAENRLLYVTEFGAPSDGRLIIHVWKVNEITSTQTYNIAGKVVYSNVAETPVSGVKVFLKNGSDVTIGSSMTDSQGNYSFSNKDPGTYYLPVSASRSWGGVNATDALAILMYSVGLVSFDSLQLRAGDVNLNGAITSVDALLIARRAVGLDTAFAAGNWVFERHQVVLSNSSIVRNIKGLCVGDVNKSYTPSSPAVSKLNLLNRGVVKLPGNNNIIEVPVRTDKNITIGAATMHIMFPNDLLQFTEVISRLPGSISKFQNGIFKFAWHNLTPVKFNAGDELIIIKFKVTKPSLLAWGRLEFLPQSELADAEGRVMDGVNLIVPEIGNSIPAEYSLENNYPNPFNPVTKICYSLPAESRVGLIVYNGLGQVVSILVDETKPAGKHETFFDAGNLSSGVYFYSIDAKAVESANTFRYIRKAILMK